MKEFLLVIHEKDEVRKTVEMIENKNFTFKHAVKKVTLLDFLNSYDARWTPRIFIIYLNDNETKELIIDRGDDNLKEWRDKGIKEITFEEFCDI